MVNDKTKLENAKYYTEPYTKIKYIASYEDDFLNLVEYNNMEEKVYEGRANNAFKYYGFAKTYFENGLYYFDFFIIRNIQKV